MVFKEVQASFWPVVTFNMRVKSGSAHRERMSRKRDANWLMADQLMRQWDEVSEDEEEITVERRLQVDKVQIAPAPVAAQAHVEKKAASMEKKRMIAGWSAKMLEEVANRQDHKGRDEMMQWIKNLSGRY